MVRIQEYPEEGELVVCSVRDVKSFGAFVILEEYEHKEGFIHIAEVATGWVKYIRDYIREGQKVVCRVLRVDESKGHVDLSLKQVNEHQKRDTIHAWKNEQKAEKLFNILCERIGAEEEKCYQDFGYNVIEEFGSLYTAFEECAINQDVLSQEGFSGEWIDTFNQIALENIVPPYVKIKGYLDLRCHVPDGVEAIKKALKVAEDAEEATVKVSYVGAPKYCLNVQAKDYKIAEDEIKKAADRAISAIEKNQGTGQFNREG